jgi:hypothetical protein
MRHLRRTCGDAAEACERGLALASRVLPLVSLTHGPSASNNYYWPEIYSNLPVGTVGNRRPFGQRHGRTRPLRQCSDLRPAALLNSARICRGAPRGREDRRYTPLDVADWLEDLANGCDEALLAMRQALSFHTPEVQRVAIDVAILSGMARFFAGKFRASIWVELFILSGVSLLIDRAEAHLKRAHLAWAGVADVARDIYHDDLTYGPQTWLRGSWQKRLQEIEIELVDVQAMRCDPPHETVHPNEEVRSVIRALDERRPTLGGGLSVQAPNRFEAGAPFEVSASLPSGSADAELVLHYRHVNQAERWASTPMTKSAGSFLAGSRPNTPARRSTCNSTSQPGARTA